MNDYSLSLVDVHLSSYLGRLQLRADLLPLALPFPQGRPQARHLIWEKSRVKSLSVPNQRALHRDCHPSIYMCQRTSSA